MNAYHTRLTMNMRKIDGKDHRWAERCKAAHKDTERQALFGIVRAVCTRT